MLTWSCFVFVSVFVVSKKEKENKTNFVQNDDNQMGIHSKKNGGGMLCFAANIPSLWAGPRWISAPAIPTRVEPQSSRTGLPL